jgi:hypothetical protein
MVIDEISLLFQIECEELNLHTVRQRMYTEHILHVYHIRPTSPTDIIFQLETMKGPISTSKGLRLANSMINGMVYEDKLIGWQKTHLRENWNKDGDLGTIGQTY